MLLKVSQRFQLLRFLKHGIHTSYQCRDKNIIKILDNHLLLQDVFPPPNSKLQTLLSKPQCIYAGFDPTADSLHVGNLLVIMALLHCQRAGHKIVALIGGATAMIGDPSGKNSERAALEENTVYENASKIAENIGRIFENHHKYFWDKQGHTSPLQPVMMVNNADWYKRTSIIDFLASVGRHFRVGTMLGRSSVESRLKSESGISFTEFSYQVLQAYDWSYLLHEHKCRFQIGGSDQMGNIMSGHELISRVSNEEVFGLTMPLVTTESGDKFGKSAGNAIWISPSKTSPFELYQFFMRSKDVDVEKLLRYFTFYSMDEVSQIMEKQKMKPESRHAHRKLAQQVTTLVHGEEGLKSAERITAALYSSSVEALSDLDATELMETFRGASVVELLLHPAMSLLELAMKAKCFVNENDARRIIAAGGFHVNHQKCQDYTQFIVPGRHILTNGVSLLRIGKKNYYIVKWLK